MMWNFNFTSTSNYPCFFCTLWAAWLIAHCSSTWARQALVVVLVLPVAIDRLKNQWSFSAIHSPRPDIDCQGQRPLYSCCAPKILERYNEVRQFLVVYCGRNIGAIVKSNLPYNLELEKVKLRILNKIDASVMSSLSCYGGGIPQLLWNFVHTKATVIPLLKPLSTGKPSIVLQPETY